VQGVEFSGDPRFERYGHLADLLFGTKLTVIANVDAIEKEYGWAIKGISGTAVCMTYRRQIELSFDIASFQGAKPSAAIDLCYMAASQEADSQPPAPEKAFFCACIRDHVRNLVPSKIKVPALLRLVSSSWDRAIAASNNIRLLNCTFPTEVVEASESCMTLKVALLLVPLETKVHIAVDIQARGTAEGIDFAIAPQAQVVYGEQFKMDKVNEYLSTRLGDRITTQEENNAVESWSDVIVELHERLIARGRR
jgi:kinetochore protein Spc7/SPC105